MSKVPERGLCGNSAIVLACPAIGKGDDIMVKAAAVEASKILEELA
jgi:hypothetical protein